MKTVLLLLLAFALPAAGTDLATLRPKGGAVSTVTAAASTTTNTSAQSFVDDLLATLNASGATGGTLDISGGNYSAPTPYIVKLNLSGMALNDGDAFGTYFGGNLFLNVVVVSNLADSSWDPDFGSGLSIGIADSPSNAAIKAKIIALTGATDNGDGTISITLSPLAGPITVVDSGTGITGTKLQGADDLANLVNNLGWSITTN